MAEPNDKNAEQLLVKLRALSSDGERLRDAQGVRAALVAFAGMFDSDVCDFEIDRAIDYDYEENDHEEDEFWVSAVFEEDTYGDEQEKQGSLPQVLNTVIYGHPVMGVTAGEYRDSPFLWDYSGEGQTSMTEAFWFQLDRWEQLDYLEAQTDLDQEELERLRSSDELIPFSDEAASIVTPCYVHEIGYVRLIDVVNGLIAYIEDPAKVNEAIAKFAAELAEYDAGAEVLELHEVFERASEPARARFLEEIAARASAQAPIPSEPAQG